MGARRLTAALLAILVYLTGSADFAAADTLVEHRCPRTGRLYALEAHRTQSSPPGGAAVDRLGEPALLDSLTLHSAAIRFLEENAPLLGLEDPSTQLQAVQRVGNVLRYEQRHLGLPVLGGEVIIHLDPDGRMTYAATKVAGNLPASSTPRIDEDFAQTIALVEAENADDPRPALTTTEPVLMFLALDIVRHEEKSDSRLVYRVTVNDVSTSGNLYSADYYVDALSGEVVLTISNLHGLDRRVFDCRPDSASPRCEIDYASIMYPPYVNGRSNNAPVRGPHPGWNIPPYYQSVDVDSLHALLGAIHSFVQSSFGLDGANNQGGIAFGSVPFSQTRGFTHINDVVSYCPNNAVFNTTNGNVNFCRGMVVADVVGHEYGHGVAFHSRYSGSNPVGYVYSGETSAIVEAFADIHGESFEHNHHGDSDWLVAATAGSGTLRDLSNPEWRTSVYTGLPFPTRHYSPGFYCGTEPGVRTYTNTYVVSHAFYLLAEGGELNGCEIEAQGIEEAKQIFTKAWRGLYLPSTATFNEAYTAFRAACADRFASEGGYAHPTCVALTTALQAVELDQPGLCSGIPEVAPPCAVNHTGTVVTTRSNGSPISTFPIGDEIWLSLSGATANRTLDFQLLPQVTSRPIWQATTALAIETADGTVLPDSTLFTMFGVAMTEGSYDVMIDGNRDGHYQPWADTILPITITPAASGVGDGTRPAVTALKAVQPNPTRDGANVAFSLANPTDVSLRVYDVAGRLVRTVASESLPAGTHVRAWDGRDDNGLPTKAGLYFVKFVAGSTVDSRKLVRTQ